MILLRLVEPVADREVIFRYPTPPHRFTLDKAW
jgi:hypothetical protein